MEISPNTAEWIWSSAEEPAPTNRFTWFRKVVELDALPQDATLRFAANSNALLYINGHCLRRKVARYDEEHITAEVVDAAPYLRRGQNVVVVLHHNWGPIITFQRTGNSHAGLYLAAEWIRSDADWRCTRAPEFHEHAEQTIGVTGDERIRFPLSIDLRNELMGDLHNMDFDDSAWAQAVGVDGRTPTDVETPGQREYPVRPRRVINAGRLELAEPLADNPFSISSTMRAAVCHPEADAKSAAATLCEGGSLRLEGRAGESRYITFDFNLPRHGYPWIELAQASAGVRIDFGYCEIARPLYSGKQHVTTDGWIDTEGVVGKGYGDRIVTREGAQRCEIPDERTVRWLALHIHFENDGAIEIADLGIIKSQYPIERIGSFDCGDERVNQILELCHIHAEVTMTDSYVDTPGREDGQWIEDARPRARLAARWYGDTQLRRLMIRTFAQGQIEDGTLHPFYPSNYPARPAFFDWSVQWAGTLYDDYFWSGDDTLVREYWDVLTRYWKHALARVDENGLWLACELFADLRVGVTVENNRQSSGIITPWMIARLRGSAELAEAIGETKQATEWRASADQMATAFRTYHVVPASGEVPLHIADRYCTDDPAAERGYSQAGQTVALSAGLLTSEEARTNLEYSFPAPDGSPTPNVTRWNNPTYFNRVLRVLSEHGLHERAVRHFIERYEPYLPGHHRNPVCPELQGPLGGPLPEYWVSREDQGLAEGEPNTTQPIDDTGSHGWAATPLLWIHEYLLGVRIAEAGGARLTIAPETGGLPYVAGHTITPKGMVFVKWDPAECRAEVRLPTGVMAEFVAPSDFADLPWKTVRADGTTSPFKNGRCVLEGAGGYVLGIGSATA